MIKIGKSHFPDDLSGTLDLTQFERVEFQNGSHDGTADKVEYKRRKNERIQLRITNTRGHVYDAWLDKIQLFGVEKTESKPEPAPEPIAEPIPEPIVPSTGEKLLLSMIRTMRDQVDAENDDRWKAIAVKIDSVIEDIEDILTTPTDSVNGNGKAAKNKPTSTTNSTNGNGNGKVSEEKPANPTNSNNSGNTGTQADSIQWAKKIQQICNARVESQKTKKPINQIVKEKYPDISMSPGGDYTYGNPLAKMIVESPCEAFPGTVSRKKAQTELLNGIKKGFISVNSYYKTKAKQRVAYLRECLQAMCAETK